uniref:Ig-like domain-containing protein n=2 Tax=Dendroctonus ponderosae TaxID=77166 RepID=A0AAR5P0M3_DENPD
MKSAAASSLVLLALFVGFTTAKLYLTHQTAVREEQQSLSVMCKDKEKGSKVMWRGPKNRPLGDRTNPMSRVTMYGVQLIFTKIRKEDMGLYTCMSESESSEFELIVSPTVDFVDTPTEVNGTEGNDIFMRCEATNARTEWLIDGEFPSDALRYQEMADGLLIKNADASDSEHDYVCKAININAGTFATRTINLTVKHRPRLKFAKEDIVYGYIGGEVDLVCEVLAEPEPKFKWFHTSPGSLVAKQVKGTTSVAKVSILKIKLRNAADLGDYKCQVSNSEGTLDVIFTVLKGTAPNPPQILDLSEATESSLALMIEEPEVTEQENRTNMLPKGFKVEYRTFEEAKWNAKRFALAEDKIYLVGNLTKNTTYQVRAATENPAGFSEFSNITEFSTTSAACAPLTFFSCTSAVLLAIVSRLI